MSGIVEYYFNNMIDFTHKILVEISTKSIFLFDNDANDSNIIYQFPIQDCRIRNGELSNKFHILHQSESYIFQTNNEETCKYWIEAFKKAQSEYWKLASSKADNDLEVSRKISVITTEMQTQSGYLMKYDKDKKIWMRFWFSLQDKILSCLKNEKVCFSFTIFYALTM